MRNTWIVSIIMLVIAGVMLTGCCAVNYGVMRAKSERTVSLSAPLTTNMTFTAKTHNGSITVAGDNQADCSVVATIVARARTKEKAKELADRTEARLVKTDAGLRAEIRQPGHIIRWNQSVSASWSVRLPSNTDLDLATHNGAIRVRDVAGRIAMETHNGSIQCVGLLGGVDAETHNGGIDLRYLESAPAACRVSATTHNGSIRLVPPSDVSARIRASTHNGTIHTDLPITVTGKVGRKNLAGTIGNGEGRLHLETHNGPITIGR